MGQLVVVTNVLPPNGDVLAQQGSADTGCAIVLRSLQTSGHVARVDAFVSDGMARATGGEVHELLVEVRGAWDKAPSHAVLAVWELQDASGAAEFIESRRQLFALRQLVLPTFAADWLLKHRDLHGRYMVLGFYGDEEGATRLCREHPAIKQFAAAHPASHYGAVDITGLLCWRIEAFNPVVVKV